MARNQFPDRPRPDRDDRFDPDDRQHRIEVGARSERLVEDDDDITAEPPTDQSESMGDVARGVGGFVGGLLDSIGNTVGGTVGVGLEGVGRGIESIGGGVQKIGQVIGGSSNPWESGSSSGGEDEGDGDDDGDDGDDGAAVGGDTMSGLESALDIQFSTAAGAAEIGPMIDLGDDATSLGRNDDGPAPLTSIDPLTIDDVASDGGWT